MNQRYYLAGFEKQLTGASLDSKNCAAASAAMLADQMTLGIRNPTPDWVRKQTGDTEGGLMMNQIAAVLDEMGIDVMLFDHNDKLKWSRLHPMLSRGHFAVVAGDYDVVPEKLNGADYQGFHAVLYQQRFVTNQRVGDPLNDGRRGDVPKGYIKWPNNLAYRYVAKFDKQTTGGIHAVVGVPHYARPRSEVAEAVIRAEPNNDSLIIGTLAKGQQLFTGGTVKGEELKGVNRWRKVWVPAAKSVGYIHWSVSWVK
jgi:hypothetical protein